MKRLANTNTPVRHRYFDVLVPSGAHLSAKIESAFTAGSYERYEGEIVQKLIHDGARVLELGGGIGFISTVACKAARPECYHLIEANPELIPVIEEVHRLNGVSGVTLENCVLTNRRRELERGHVEFAVAANFTASSTRKLGIGRREISVPARSFNDYVSQTTFDMLICDIEGGEESLFHKAELAGFGTVIVEIHTAITGLGGVDRMFRAMSRAGLAYDEAHSRGSVVVFRRYE